MYTRHTTYQISNLFHTHCWKSNILQISAFKLYTKSIAKDGLIAKQQKTCAAQIFFLLKNLNMWLWRRMCLLGLGKADPVVVPIKDGVVLTDEYISQNPQGPGGGGDVQTHEAAQTHGLSSLRHLDNFKKEKDTQSETELLKTNLRMCNHASTNNFLLDLPSQTKLHLFRLL